MVFIGIGELWVWKVGKKFQKNNMTKSMKARMRAMCSIKNRRSKGSHCSVLEILGWEVSAQ